MASFSVVLLSGSTSGLPIPVAATATPGTLLHNAVAGSVNFDEVYLYAANVTAAAVVLTVEWGGTTDPDNLLVKQFSIPANSGPVQVAVGQRINGGVAIRAFAATAGAINITGSVNRIVS